MPRASVRFASSFRIISARGELMARPPGSGRPSCESVPSIDVREWARKGCLRPNELFSWSWSHGGEPCGSITVRIGPDVVPAAAFVGFRSRRSSGNRWRSVEQRVPITWIDCHFGGWRPWFHCTACGRRVAILYSNGDLFACRNCEDLPYASQQQSPRDRSINRARAIRMKLGGGPSLIDPFPDRPRGMHWRTYERLRARAEASEEYLDNFLMRYLR